MGGVGLAAQVGLTIRTFDSRIVAFRGNINFHGLM